MADIEFIVEGDGGFLSGNEAVARGVLEAGVSVGTSYPGSPASRITVSYTHLTLPTKA